MSCVWMSQSGHSGDGCVLASTLYKYDLRKGDLFVLSWARVRRVRRGSLSSFFSSVTSDLSELSHMSDSIKDDINNVCLSSNHSCGSFYDHTVYRINVTMAIRSLCAGKSNRADYICSDNLKHATDIFIDYIVSLFNSILSHGCVCTYQLSFVYHNTHTKKIHDWTLKPKITLELVHSLVCLANFLKKLSLRSKLNSLAHRNYNLATKLQVLL